MKVLNKVAVSRASYAIEKTNGAYAVAVDGKATARIVRAAEKAGVKVIAAKNFGEVGVDGIEFVSF